MIGSDYPKNWGNDKDEWYADIHFMGLVAIEDLSKNKDFELMQYTGLKDQNGKEIYEGDILVPTNKEMRSIVKFGEATVGDDFHEQTFVGWYLENKNGAVDELNDFEVNSEYRKMEVIGNIHENPELLEK